MDGLMRKLDWTEPLQEDVDAYSFRIANRTGSWCCSGHHLLMLAVCLVSDEIDADIIWRGVRTCTSLRWADMDVGQWLRDQAAEPCELRHSSELFAEILKKGLDF